MENYQESDELAITYLMECDYDVKKALSKLYCQLGYGKDYMHADRIAEYMGRHSSGTAFSECKDRFMNSKKPLMGAFESHSSYSQHHNHDDDDDAFPFLGTNGKIASANDNGRSDDMGRDLSAEESSNNDADTAHERGEKKLGTSRSNLARSSNNDKNQVKKTWQNLYRQASLILGKQSGGGIPTSKLDAAGDKVDKSPKPGLVEAQGVLDEAHNLPSYVNSPGEDFGEQCRAIMGELLVAVSDARVWVSEVTDALHAVLKPTTPTTLAMLRRLLKESSNLKAPPWAEISMLKGCLGEAARLNRDARAWLSKVPGSFSEIDGWGSVHGCATATLSNSGETLASANEESAGLEDEYAVDEVPDALVYKGKIPREAIQTWMKDSKKLPTAPCFTPYSQYMIKLQSLVESMAVDVERMIHRAAVCGLRRYRAGGVSAHYKDSHVKDSTAADMTSGTETTKQATGSVLRVNLSSAQSLCDRVEALPFALPFTNELLRLVDAGSTWLNETRDLLQQAQSSQSKAKAVSLKRVESLIAEGEKLPFEFEDDLERLREKRTQAKSWLERLKKSFQAQGKGRNSVRRGQEEEVPKVERMCLADMRQLVEEGEVLFEDAGNGDVNGAVPSIIGARTQARELSKAQTVVDMAEEWLNRVRELVIDSTEDEYEDEGSDHGKDDEGDAEKTDSEDLQSMLSELLEEADSMPVHMDEATVLRNHVQALAWAERARKILPLPRYKIKRIVKPPKEPVPEITAAVAKKVTMDLEVPVPVPVVEEETKDLDADAIGEEDIKDENDRIPCMVKSVMGSMVDSIESVAAGNGNPSSGPDGQDLCSTQQAILDALIDPKLETPPEPIAPPEPEIEIIKTLIPRPADFKKPKISELHDLVNEIKHIRAELPADVAAQYPVKHLKEELYVMEMLEAGELWQKSAKKMMQGTTIRKGISLSNLIASYHEGNALPVSLSRELGPISSAITAAEDWIEENRPALTKLGIESTHVCALRVEKSEKGSDDADVDASEKDIAADVESTADTEMKQDDETTDGAEDEDVDSLVTYQELKAIVDAGSGMNAEFDEIIEVRDRLEACENWINQVHDKVPKHLSTQLLASCGRRHKTVVKEPVTTLKRSESSSLSDLLTLLTEGSELKMSLINEMACLRTAISSAQKWNESAMQSVTAMLDASLQPIVNRARSVSQQIISSKSFPFIEGFNISAIESISPRPESPSGSDGDEGEGRKVKEETDVSNATEGDDASKAIKDEGAMQVAISSPSLPEAEKKVKDEPVKATGAFSAFAAIGSADGAADTTAAATDEPITTGDTAVTPALVEDRSSTPPIEDPESALWDGVPELFEDVEKLREEGHNIGVSVDASVLLDLTIGAAYWAEEVKRLLMFPSMKPAPSATAEGEAIVEKKKPRRMKFWGDIKREEVESLERDCMWLMEAEFERYAASIEPSDGEEPKEEAYDIRSKLNDLFPETDVLAAFANDDLEYEQNPRLLKLFPLPSRRSAASRNASKAGRRTSAGDDGEANGNRRAKRGRHSSPAETPRDTESVEHESVSEAGGMEVVAEESAIVEEEANAVVVAEKEVTGRGTGKRKSKPSSKVSGVDVKGAVAAAAATAVGSNGEDAQTKGKGKGPGKGKGSRGGKGSAKRSAPVLEEPGADPATLAEGPPAKKKAKGKRAGKHAAEGAAIDGAAATDPPVAEVVTGKKGKRKGADSAAAAESVAAAAAAKADKKDKVSAKEEKVQEEEEEVFENSYDLISQYQKAYKSATTKLPTPLLEFLDLWLRWLRLLKARVSEAEMWSEHGQFLHNKLSGSNGTAAARATVPDMSKHLDGAISRGIKCKQRYVIEEYLFKAHSWRVRAAMMKRQEENATLLDPEDFKDFLKEGEKLVICDDLSSSMSSLRNLAIAPVPVEILGYKPTEEEEKMAFLSVMRNELKRAKAWITKFEQSGYETDVLKSCDMEAAVSEAQSICIDLSQFVDTIQQSLMCYCLCRQAYHGEMVGCDTCDDWYHFSCIGMKKVQVEKSDKFVCIRCVLLSSFQSTITSAATIANRWMVPDELCRMREARTAKALKKRVKEEKEVQRLEKLIAHLLGLIARKRSQTPKGPKEPSAFAAEGDSSSAMDILAGATVTSPPVPPVQDIEAAAKTTLTAPLDGEALENVTMEVLEYQLKELQRDQHEALERLKVSIYDESKAQEQNEFETSKQNVAVQWMQAMQEVMWPRNNEDLNIGRPLAPPPQPVEGLEEFSLEGLGIRSDMLSDGMHKAAEAARAIGVITIEDVKGMLDMFRWMSWLNICLHALRRPMPTTTLRNLVAAGSTLAKSDEKILKPLSNIATRGSAWKSKARKLSVPKGSAAGKGKWVEGTKLLDTVIEGAGMPIVSRVKDKLRAELEKFQEHQVNTQGDGVSIEAPVVPPTPTGDEPKKKGKTSITPSLKTHAMLSEELDDSSDEERSASEQGLITAGKMSGAGIYDGARYTKVPKSALAAPPKDLWPPKISFGPVRKVAAAASAPASGAGGASGASSTSGTTGTSKKSNALKQASSSSAIPLGQLPLKDSYTGKDVFGGTASSSSSAKAIAASAYQKTVSAAKPKGSGALGAPGTLNGGKGHGSGKGNAKAGSGSKSTFSSLSSTSKMAAAAAAKAAPPSATVVVPSSGSKEQPAKEKTKSVSSTSPTLVPAEQPPVPVPVEQPPVPVPVPVLVPVPVEQPPTLPQIGEVVSSEGGTSDSLQSTKMQIETPSEAREATAEVGSALASFTSSTAKIAGTESVGALDEKMPGAQ